MSSSSSPPVTANQAIMSGGVYINSPFGAPSPWKNPRFVTVKSYNYINDWLLIKWKINSGENLNIVYN